MDRAAGELEELGGRRGGATELVDTAVVGHPEQPRPECQLALARSQARVRAYEHVLQGVLGVLAAREHLPGVAQQSLLVPVVDDPECLVVPGAEQGDQLLVRA